MNKPISRILVYIDGSEVSVGPLLCMLLFLAKTLNAELCAMYVINTRALNDLVSAKIFLASEEVEYHRDLEKDAERYLRHITKMAEKKNVKIDTKSVSGTIHREIKNEIKEHDYDILVIGGISNIRSRRDEFF